MADDLTGEDYQDLQDAHAHLRAIGDPRADKLHSYLSSAGYPPAPAPPLPMQLQGQGNGEPEQGFMSRLMFGPTAATMGLPPETKVLDQSPFFVPTPGSALAKGVGGALSGAYSASKEIPLVGKFLRIPEAVYKGASEAINPPVEPFPVGKGTGTKYGGPMRPEYGPAKPMPSVTPTAPPAGYTPGSVPEPITPFAPGKGTGTKYGGPIAPEYKAYPSKPVNPTVPPSGYTPTTPEPITPYPVGKGTGTKYGGSRTDVFGKPGKIIPRGQFTPPPEPSGPEINIEGVGPVRPIQTGPVNVPGATPQTVTPFKAEEAVTDAVRKAEMNKSIHARIQELNLPGSPSGQKAPGLARSLAKSRFGKDYSNLSYEEMADLWNHLPTLAK